MICAFHKCDFNYVKRKMFKKDERNYNTIRKKLHFLTESLFTGPFYPSFREYFKLMSDPLSTFCLEVGVDYIHSETKEKLKGFPVILAFYHRIRVCLVFMKITSKCHGEPKAFISTCGGKATECSFYFNLRWQWVHPAIKQAIEPVIKPMKVLI